MPKITYNNDKIIEVENESELKDAIEKNGWEVPLACEDGLCGTCIVKVTDGMENLNETDEKEKITLTAMGLMDGKHRLACQCKVKGDIKIETM